MISGTYLDEITPIITTGNMAGGTYLNWGPSQFDSSSFGTLNPKDLLEASNTFAKDFYQQFSYFTDYLTYSVYFNDADYFPTKSTATVFLMLICLDYAKAGIIEGNLEKSMISTSIISLIFAEYLHGLNVSE